MNSSSNDIRSDYEGIEWKSGAMKFLSNSKIFSIGDLKEISAKLSRSPPESTKAKVIAQILEKLIFPDDLLSKREVTVDKIRQYLKVDGRYSATELKDMIVQRWSTEGVRVPQTPDNGVSSTATQKLYHWRKITNCVTNEAHCSGCIDGKWVDTGFFLDRDLHEGDEIVDSNNQIYVLGSRGNASDETEDTFGPWPSKMKENLNSGNKVLRNLLSETVSSFRARLTTGVSGNTLDHMSTFNHIYAMTKTINAIEIRKAIRASLELNEGVALTTDVVIQEAMRRNIPVELINAVEDVYILNEQLKEASSKVHNIIHLKDDGSVLEQAMIAEAITGSGQSTIGPSALYKMRPRALAACEKRAEQCRLERKLEKESQRLTEAIGDREEREAMRQKDARRHYLAIKNSLRRNKLLLHRLDVDRINAEDEMNNLLNERQAVRRRMATTIEETGEFDQEDKEEETTTSTLIIDLKQKLSVIMLQKEELKGAIAADEASLTKTEKVMNGTISKNAGGEECTASKKKRKRD
mmetsp:Transcript_22522/g.32901  ORF Transcript_22522/g.32901 Transcript_22522/m.32901 type:complete len:523 (+) Transcript_22522:408-1976(+)|eukprot:CAMPEP_0185037064 /NCGR_PEP_ID=MMETSP1103-20130426/30957_1 /TAXON_ID=36769 /ORGANISM="Paraphysomonas bandaiensis, Strain Caron Lab Isolate" /LENGTH=522 /DNA_ID=CAMNT_0027574867 /DNA_START=369 /DNA_END=1937 /DNA_ORIENTATION=+